MTDLDTLIKEGRDRLARCEYGGYSADDALFSFCRFNLARFFDEIERLRQLHYERTKSTETIIAERDALRVEIERFTTLERSLRKSMHERQLGWNHERDALRFALDVTEARIIKTHDLNARLRSGPKTQTERDNK